MNHAQLKKLYLSRLNCRCFWLARFRQGGRRKQSCQRGPQL